MIDKSALIAIVSRIDTQWKEVVLELLLYFNVILIIALAIVHIKEVAHSGSVIFSAPIISAPHGDDLSNVLNDESA